MSSVKRPNLGLDLILSEFVFIFSIQPVHALWILLYIISDFTHIYSGIFRIFSEKKRQKQWNNAECVSSVRITEWKRIRVTEHPLQIHLLFAVRAHLLLSDDTPSSYAELVEPGYGVKARHCSMWATIQTYNGSKCHYFGHGSLVLKYENIVIVEPVQVKIHKQNIINFNNILAETCF